MLTILYLVAALTLAVYSAEVPERDGEEYNELLAQVGIDVWLNCSSTATIGTDVDWRYQPYKAQSAVVVYQSGYFQHGFGRRFTARRHNNMKYSLTIRNVTVNDSGIYLCTEQQGQGRTHYYAVNVTAKIVSNTTSALCAEVQYLCVAFKLLTVVTSVFVFPFSNSTSALCDEVEYLCVAFKLVAVVISIFVFPFVIYIIALLYWSCCGKILDVCVPGY